ncbi:TrmH family RNA methyltransferase [Intrasporangium calvum]|uniref:tRNA/rRNA methyltransferase (SpoU) n=1 Tax=Intrasporangium calvum (strain ATCC 23552 / DSM 43043 / JCM 3097 / NBRC 12989 / NCIMB 10167 / NRRL B-3866 / 7 KIP) TaxID=710696 RepID=E6S620_INTC7|nr:RNA methyltransferase [Intrasporangium calvum]ADU46760.1 tRNA/rRNA methyltransferase (SpoU) [Intrasporangium calvum DSM 43043]
MNLPRDLSVSSPSNPRLKALVALRRRRVREETGQTIVEGHEEIRLALDAGVTPRTLYVAEELFSPSGRAGSQEIGTQPELVERLRAAGVEIVRLSPAAYAKVSYREGPDGLLAVVDDVGVPLASLTVDGPSWLGLVAQRIEKPGNLGAMLRTADAAGVDAVVAADPVTDWGNPNVVRASKGTLFAVPVASGTTSETLAWLAHGAVTLVVTTPETDLLHTEVDYTGRVAIAVGSEKHGVDDALLVAATHRVRIPMHGRANSLNVSVAAAVVLYEAVRQRASRLGGGGPA